MARKLSSKQKTDELHKLFAQYNKRLGRLYSDYVKKLASLGYGEDVLEGDALFNFDNFPELKARLDDIFASYFTDSVACYKQGMSDGVSLAFSHDTGVLSGFSVMSDKAIDALRNAAAETFVSSRLKSKNGLNLSQRIWNYCQQTKSEFEMAMSNVIADGIKGGISAEELGRKVRKYLNDPDMMYRRYHTVKVLKNGQKKDVVTWRRRRVIGGKVRFVEEPLENVGAGVYRSSRMNALRVARTEINAAYLRGHNARWAKEPFVIGQWIHRSPQHKIEDICDELEGRYPKDFVFSNWHPQCLCTADPILISGDEKKQFYDRLYAGEDMSGYQSPFAVTDVPEEYKQYIRNNEAAIMKAYKGDRLAWHLADNKKYWQGLCSAENQKLMGVVKDVSREEKIREAAEHRHAKRDAAKIQRQWTQRRTANYMERMNSVIAGLTYSNDNSLVGDALAVRYNAVRLALKSPTARSVANVERLYQRFVNGAAIRESWDKQVWEGFSKEQIANCREIERVLGIKKGRPMTWEMANYGKENPKYYIDEQYRVNCQTCTVVHELRRRGFNITAKGKYEGFNTIDEKVMRWWQRFTNPDATDVNMKFSSTWKRINGFTNMTNERKLKFLFEQMPVDGRYEVYCQWKGKSAHVFNVNRTKGQYLWFDAQSGRYGKVVENYVKEMKGTGISVIRIDDKIINPEMCKAFNAKTRVAYKHSSSVIKIQDNAPAGFFEDVRNAKTAKERVLKIKEFLSSKSEHFTELASTKGGKIFSPFMDRYDKALSHGEFPKNIAMAKKIAKYGYDVYMMPNPNKGNSFDFIFKKDGKYWIFEGKAFNGKATLGSLIDGGATQADRLLLDIIGNKSAHYIAEVLKKGFENNVNLAEIWLLKGSRLIKISRQMLCSNKFEENFKKAWK